MNAQELKSKKITRATFKSFINKNRENLFIEIKNSFDGMTDGCEPVNSGIKPAGKTECSVDNDFGINGVWLVGGNDSFSFIETGEYFGIHVYNCCVSFNVYIKKEDGAPQITKALETEKKEVKIDHPQAEAIEKLAALMNEHHIEYLKKFNMACETNIKNGKAVIIPGRKYTKIDKGRSGKLMIDNEGNIFGIKAYGQVHKGHRYGTLETIDKYFWGAFYPVTMTAWKESVRFM